MATVPPAFSAVLTPYLAEYERLRLEILANPRAEIELADQNEILETLKEQQRAYLRDEDKLKVAVIKEQQHLTKLEKFGFTQIGAKLKGKQHYRNEIADTQTTLFKNERKLEEDVTIVQDLTLQISAATAELQHKRREANDQIAKRRMMLALLDESFKVGRESSREDTFSFVAQLEQRHSLIVSQVNEKSKKKSNFATAATELTAALRNLSSCIGSIESALQSAQTDLYFRNEFSEFNEYQQSNNAQINAQRAGQHIQTAAQYLPNEFPASVGLLHFNGLSALGTLFFDNFWSDLQNISYLQQVDSQMRNTIRNVEAILIWVENSLQDLDIAIHTDQSTITSLARQSLHFRVDCFEAGLRSRSFDNRFEVINSYMLIPDSMIF
ncbi:hypothetical protein HK100_008011 [Physocladia obscura]|uniref:Uncharacterized protein n=1 Tax=Physocladia obscura TaxID=109957 RepID=A0AAD5SPI9_9FUNG|nr:hypothetical protein HK100_008011 [Physocladia obscura]